MLFASDRAVSDIGDAIDINGSILPRRFALWSEDHKRYRRSSQCLIQLNDEVLSLQRL